MKSARSKVLHSVCGKPLCHWVIEKALQVCDGPIVVVVGFQADEVQKNIEGRFGARILFAQQKEQKGTADAVFTGLGALPDFHGTLLVMYGDTPALDVEKLSELCKNQHKSNCKVALLTTQHFFAADSGYGRIVRQKDGSIAKIVEEIDASEEEKKINEVNVGVYAFDADFLRQIPLKLKPSNKKNELYLTDAIALAKTHAPVVSIEIPYHESIGVNDRSDLARIEYCLYQQIVERWMLAGVTFSDSAHICVEAEVRLGQDILLEPGVQLRGKTLIANNVTIGTGSILRDTIVEEGAVIHPYSICENAHIGRNAQVGPFARLRPNSILEENAKIGNFVETKNTRFRKGSKANHLAYIGDAEVGEASNVGAGTITCNYDGFGKHKTILGDRVFIGSNSTLVAPLTIGNGAYVAAGSTVTKDVADNTLAIGRGRQENKAGYASRLRDRLKKRKETDC